MEPLNQFKKSIMYIEWAELSAEYLETIAASVNSPSIQTKEFRVEDLLLVETNLWDEFNQVSVAFQNAITGLGAGAKILHINWDEKRRGSIRTRHQLALEMHEVRGWEPAGLLFIRHKSLSE